MSAPVPTPAEIEVLRLLTTPGIILRRSRGGYWQPALDSRPPIPADPVAIPAGWYTRTQMIYELRHKGWIEATAYRDPDPWRRDYDITSAGREALARAEGRA